MCLEAKSGQILLSQRAYAKVEHKVRAEPIGELALKGLHRPRHTTFWARAPALDSRGSSMISQ